VPAVVTNITDPDQLGRVKVKFPWLAEDQESNWARIISPGAGNKAGLIAVPSLDDEVMVAFEHGDFNRPYVLGGVWNGKKGIPGETGGAPSGNIDQIREIRSTGGHYIAMYETSGDKKIVLMTAGGHSIVIDDQNKKVDVKSSGGQQVGIDDQGRKVTVSGTGDIDIKATMNVNIKASAQVKIEATGPAEIKGATLTIQASGPVTIKGNPVAIN
jgi:uncharacterized protein involved in type VI secretion and phage assembly